MEGISHQLITLDSALPCKERSYWAKDSHSQGKDLYWFISATAWSCDQSWNQTQISKNYAFAVLDWSSGKHF